MKDQNNNNQVDFLEIQGLTEGVDYISLVRESNTPIGRALSTTNLYKFNTVVGDVVSISRFMQYLSTEAYPTRFLLKRIFSSKDTKLISNLKTLKLPNYWAAMCYVACERISQDETLIKWIKENTLPFTIARWEVRKKFMPNNNTPCLVNITKLSKYLSIIRDIEKLIKGDKFTEPNIVELIDSYKEDPEKDIFYGSSIWNMQQFARL